MVVPNWFYSGRVRVHQPRSQPLAYRSLEMRAPAPLPVTTMLHTPQYGSPTGPPPQTQQQFPLPPPNERPTSMDNYPCTDPSPRNDPTHGDMRPTQSACPQLERHNRQPHPEPQIAHPEANSPHPIRNLIPSCQHSTLHIPSEPASCSTNSPILLESMPNIPFMFQRGLII